MPCRRRSSHNPASITHTFVHAGFAFPGTCTCVRCAPVTWLKPTCSRSSSSCLSLPIFLSWTPELARQAARLNLACTRCQLNPRRSQEETPTQSGNAEAPQVHQLTVLNCQIVFSRCTGGAASSQMCSMASTQLEILCKRLQSPKNSSRPGRNLKTNAARCSDRTLTDLRNNACDLTTIRQEVNRQLAPFRDDQTRRPSPFKLTEQFARSLCKTPFSSLHHLSDPAFSTAVFQLSNKYSTNPQKLCCVP